MRHIADFIAKGLGVFAKVAKLGQIRIFMNPVNPRDLGIANLACHGLVGRQHEFLNQLVRDVVDVFLNSRGPALFVEPDLDFRKVEIQRALGKPLRPEFGRQAPHLF